MHSMQCHHFQMVICLVPYFSWFCLFITKINSGIGFPFGRRYWLNRSLSTWYIKSWTNKWSNKSCSIFSLVCNPIKLYQQVLPNLEARICFLSQSVKFKSKQSTLTPNDIPFPLLLTSRIKMCSSGPALLHANFPIVMKEVRQNIVSAPDRYLTWRTFGTGSIQILIKQPAEDVLQKTLRVSACKGRRMRLSTGF